MIIKNSFSSLDKQVVQVDYLILQVIIHIHCFLQDWLPNRWRALDELQLASL